MHEQHAGAVVAHNGSGWDPASLEPLAEINERVLEVLASDAAQVPLCASPLSPLLAAEWQSLGTAGRARLAASPYLLLDCRFADSELWSGPLHEGVRDGSAGYGFASALGPGAIRHAVLLAWHWSRTSPATARIALGLGEAAARRLAGTRLRELEVRAERCPEWIRPRWEDRPAIWRQLVHAAAPANAATLRLLQLRGLQLLAAAGA